MSGVRYCEHQDPPPHSRRGPGGLRVNAMLDHAKRMKDGAAEPVEAPPLPHNPEWSPAILKMPGATEMPASQRPVENLKRRPPLKRIAAAVILVLALAAGSWFGIHWWTVGRFFVSTDDAYV